MTSFSPTILFLPENWSNGTLDMALGLSVTSVILKATTPDIIAATKALCPWIQAPSARRSSTGSNGFIIYSH